MPERFSSRPELRSCFRDREILTQRGCFVRYRIRPRNRASCTRYPDCRLTSRISNPGVLSRHVAITYRKFVTASFHLTYNSHRITTRSAILRAKFTVSQAAHRFHRLALCNLWMVLREVNDSTSD